MTFGANNFYRNVHDGHDNVYHNSHFKDDDDDNHDYDYDDGNANDDDDGADDDNDDNYCHHHRRHANKKMNEVKAEGRIEGGKGRLHRVSCLYICYHSFDDGNDDDD